MTFNGDIPVRSFSISVQGASHKKRGQECQDAARHDYDETCAIAIVCDGHGGDDYILSAEGAKLAARVAEHNIKIFLRKVDQEKLNRNPAFLMEKLEASIISDWNEAVAAHHVQNPFTEDQLARLSLKARKRYVEENQFEIAYGTTLIAAAWTSDYWFGIQIGDGRCVTVNPQGEFSQPIPWDDNCFLNATTSMCDRDALHHFRHFYSRNLPVAVFVGSDGVDDSFNNEQQLYQLYKTVLYSFSSCEFACATHDLADYLPRLSARGSGDDLSIAAILDLDRIGQLEIVTAYDREKEKNRVAERVREATEQAERERQQIRERQERAQEQTHTEEEADFDPPDEPLQFFCPYCGAPISSDAAFCGHCGKPRSFTSHEPSAK